MSASEKMKALREVIEAVKRVAKYYRQLTGKPLGITGEEVFKWHQRDRWEYLLYNRVEQIYPSRETKSKHPVVALLYGAQLI